MTDSHTTSGRFHLSGLPLCSSDIQINKTLFLPMLAFISRFYAFACNLRLGYH